MSVEQSNIDLLSMTLHDTLLKRKGGTNGGEWAGACPFCGGTDRFLVWPHHPQGPRWWCRGENKGGDAIEYVMRRDNVSFKDALVSLNLTHQIPSRPYRPPRPTLSKPRQHVGKTKDWIALNDRAWQAAARQFADQASERIYDHPSALQYLFDRGFTETTIAFYWLGYNPTDIYPRWGETTVFLPAGWVIPWMFAGDIWRLNVRRLPAKEEKYRGPTGNANGLYNAALIKPTKPVVIVEGEFDCMAIAQAAHDLVTPVATGSTSGARLQKWIARIAQASGYIVAFDDDEPGQKAAQFWLDVLPGSVRLVPRPHDPNDMLKTLGPEAIRDWLRQVL